MFIRFVRLQVRQDNETEFRNYYEGKVIPALGETDGCLFAGLLRPWRGTAYQSLTMWDSAENAHDYEGRGHYHALLRGAEPFLSPSTVWRVQTGENPEETLDHDRREIPPDEYTVEAGDPPENLDEPRPSNYVRIVSLSVAEGRREEFHEIYENTVIPAVKAQPGCRAVLLARGLADRNEVLSITLWDREEDAVRYEMSGEYERLNHRLRDTYSRLQDWRMSLGAGGDAADTPEAQGYHFVVARKL